MATIQARPSTAFSEISFFDGAVQYERSTELELTRQLLAIDKLLFHEVNDRESPREQAANFGSKDEVGGSDSSDCQQNSNLFEKCEDNSEKKSLLAPVIVRECKRWRRKFPFLRIIGKAILKNESQTPSSPSGTKSSLQQTPVSACCKQRSCSSSTTSVFNFSPRFLLQEGGSSCSNMLPSSLSSFKSAECSMKSVKNFNEAGAAYPQHSYSTLSLECTPAIIHHVQLSKYNPEMLNPFPEIPAEHEMTEETYAQHGSCEDIIAMDTGGLPYSSLQHVCGQTNENFARRRRELELKGYPPYTPERAAAFQAEQENLESNANSILQPMSVQREPSDSISHGITADIEQNHSHTLQTLPYNTQATLDESSSYHFRSFSSDDPVSSLAVCLPAARNYSPTKLSALDIAAESLNDTNLHADAKITCESLPKKSSLKGPLSQALGTHIEENVMFAESGKLMGVDINAPFNHVTVRSPVPSPLHEVHKRSILRTSHRDVLANSEHKSVDMDFERSDERVVRYGLAARVAASRVPKSPRMQESQQQTISITSQLFSSERMQLKRRPVADRRTAFPSVAKAMLTSTTTVASRPHTAVPNSSLYQPSETKLQAVRRIAQKEMTAKSLSVDEQLPLNQLSISKPTYTTQHSKSMRKLDVPRAISDAHRTVDIDSKRPRTSVTHNLNIHDTHVINVNYRSNFANDTIGSNVPTFPHTSTHQAAHTKNTASSIQSGSLQSHAVRNSKLYTAALHPLSRTTATHEPPSHSSTLLPTPKRGRPRASLAESNVVHRDGTEQPAPQYKVSAIPNNRPTNNMRPFFPHRSSTLNRSLHMSTMKHVARLSHKHGPHLPGSSDSFPYKRQPSMIRPKPLDVF